MTRNPLPFGPVWVLLLALLCLGTDSALATPTFGTRMNNWCAARPVQATPPQQSRPYQAAGSSCALCHTSSGPSANDLNAIGDASASCTGTGTATTCGSTFNQYCVATPPSNASITAPPAGTTVAQGAPVTFSAANATNPDGFPLTYTWVFTGGLANAVGQSVAVSMTAAGSITATLQVRNSVGMLATGTAPTRTVTVTGAANQAPTANITSPAASVSINTGGTVSFAGSGNDPDNNLPLAFAWSFPGGSPASSTAQNPGAVTYATAGSYTASLTVTDSLGSASATVTRTITVGAAANQAPMAGITSPAASVSINTGGTVSFAGSGNDPDGNLPLAFAWSFPGGSPASSTAQNPGSVTYAGAGTYTASLTVTDSLGLASAAATRTVTVGAVGQDPVATIVNPIGDISIARGDSVTFEGTGSDPGNNLPLRHEWKFQEGTPSSSRQQNPGAVRFDKTGTFRVTYRITNSRGVKSDFAMLMVTVTTEPANQAPAASIVSPADNPTIAAGQSVSFAGAGSDPDNNLPLAFAWDFPGGTPASSTAQEPGPVAYASEGSYTATLTVTDGLGLASAPVTRTITVTPAAQVAAASIIAPAMDVSVLPGGRVEFAGAGTGSGQLRYQWRFQNGSPSSSTRQNPGLVRFSKVGRHTVTLTVQDERGRSEAVTRVITVAPDDQRPGEVSPCVAGREEEREREKERDRRHSRERDDD